MTQGRHPSERVTLTVTIDRRQLHDDFICVKMVYREFGNDFEVPVVERILGANDFMMTDGYLDVSFSEMIHSMKKAIREKYQWIKDTKEMYGGGS